MILEEPGMQSPLLFLEQKLIYCNLIVILVSIFSNLIGGFSKFI